MVMDKERRLEGNQDVGIYPQRILSICSGGGGLDRGIDALLPLARTVCYVEIELGAAGLLVQGMDAGVLDRAPIFSDVRKFAAGPGTKLAGLVDGIIGGYPCQPFSVAGQQTGSGHEAHLWPHIKDIVADLNPAWVFFENVSNHINLGFREVALDLLGLGYRVAAIPFRASDTGAPHQRDRLWIMGTRWTGVDGDAGALADTSGARRAILDYARSLGPEVQEAGVEAGQPFGPGALSVYPPSPSDLDGWLDYLFAPGADGASGRGRRLPSLPPPSVAELRGTSDGLAGRVVGQDPGRVSKLLALGQGVHPPTAILAFYLLSRSLGITERLLGQFLQKSI